MADDILFGEKQACQQFNDPANAEPSVLFGASIVALTYVAAWLFSSGITTIVTGRKAV